MKTLALIFLAAGTLALQACSNGGPVPIPGGSSASSASTSSPEPTSSAASSAESTSSAASSAGPEPVALPGDPENGASLFSDPDLNCAGCHAPNDGNDGTFGGAVGDMFYFDVNQFRFPTSDFDGATYANDPAGLSAYINDLMPPRPELCVDDCADDIAAYLWSLRNDYVPIGQPPVSSSSAASSISSVASSSDSAGSDPGVIVSSSSEATSSSVGTPSSDPASNASSSSDSSVSPPEGATVEQARDYVVQINNLGHSVKTDRHVLGNLGTMLWGSDSEAYNDFATQLRSSEVMGDELDHVLKALELGGTAFGARFVRSVAGADVIPAPDEISLDGYTVVSGGSALNPTRSYQFTFNDTISVCDDGDAASCNVTLVMDIELDFPTSQPTGADEGGTTTLQLGQMNFVVRQLSASNGYVSIDVAAGEQVISADRVVAQVQMDDDNNILSALVASEGFSSDLQVVVRDLQANGSSLDVALSGGVTDLEVTLDMLSDDMSVSLVNLAGAAFEGNATFTNQGNNLSADFAVAPSIVGEGPFTYIFVKDDDLVREGEDASNYLGLNASVNFTAEVGGESLLRGNIEGSRTSDTTAMFESYTLQPGSLTYVVTGVEFNLDGDILALEGVDPISGVSVSVSTSDGTTTGTVSNGSETLGTIARNASGELIITYNDDTTQRLRWGAGAAGPAPDPDGVTPTPPPVSSSSSAASSVSSALSSTSSVASSSSSATSTPPDVIGDFDLETAKEFYDEFCSACHADNQNGTFGVPGGPFFIDPDNLRFEGYSDDFNGLVAYIDAEMPGFGQESTCVGECAEYTAAYLWSFRSDQQPPVSSSSAATSSSLASSVSSDSSVSSAPPVVSSSSAATSSASSASSEAPGEPATVEQAVEFGSEVSKLASSIKLDANAILNLGNVLQGQDLDAYSAFANEMQSSSLLSAELDNVLAGLGQVGLAFGSRFVQSVAGSAVFDAPEGISTDGYNVVSGGSALNPERYYQFTFSGEVVLEECEGGAESCTIQVDMEIELAFPNSQPTGAVENDGVNVRLQMAEMQLVVTELSASNGFVSVEVSPGDNVIFASGLVVDAVMDADGAPISADVGTTGLGSDLELTVRDVQNPGANIQGTLIGSLDVAEMLVDMLSDDMTLTLSSLSGAGFGGNAVMANSQGDNLSAEYSVAADVVGNGPFTYVFGEEFERIGESAGNYMGANGSLEYSAEVGGSTLFQGSLTGSRSSDTAISVEDYTIEYAGSRFTLSVEFDIDTYEIISMSARDPDSGVTISGDSSSGSFTGIVVDAAGNELGTVGMNDEGKIVITYTDGTVQII